MGNGNNTAFYFYFFTMHYFFGMDLKVQVIKIITCSFILKIGYPKNNKNSYEPMIIWMEAFEYKDLEFLILFK